MNRENLTKVGAGKMHKKNLRNPVGSNNSSKDKTSNKKQKKQFNAFLPSQSKAGNNKKFNIFQPDKN
jgi:hypothetical protein